jgi:Asp-tRNA(Asn)/Glu-tRNA(Gln) amidotransferase C subunit
MKTLFAAAAEDNVEEPQEEPAEETETPPAKEKPAPKPKAAPEPEPEPEEKPIVRRKKKDLPVEKVERPPLPKAEPEPPPAPKREIAAPDTPTDDDLEDHEKEMIKDAKELEQRFPEKHKGLAAKAEKYIRDHLKKLNEVGGDDQDPDYRAWVEKNKVRVDPREYDALREARITERVRKESDEKYNGLEHELFVRSEQPNIKSEGTRLYVEMAQASVPKEVAEAVQKLGIEEAKKYYGLELEVADMVVNAAADDAEEFLRITRRHPTTGKTVVPFDPQNKQHVRLAQMVADTCEEFKNSGVQKDLQRDGKWFVTREEWNGMQAAHRKNFWTFTDSEILKRAQAHVPAAVKGAIEARIGEMKRYNFARPAYNPQPAPVQNEEPAPSPVRPTPPAPRPAPVPGRPPANGSTSDPRARTLASNLGMA